MARAAANKTVATKVATSKAAKAKVEERPLSVTLRRVVRATPMLPATKPASVGLSSHQLDALTAAMTREIARGTIPGVVMMVARHGKVAYFEALGKQEPSGSAAMARNSIFRIMSMTKPIVSIGLMQLVEAGYVLLNDPVSKYIPEFRNQNVGVARGDALELVPVQREVTVQDLLRHTSGIVYESRGDGPVFRAYAAAGVRNRNLTNEQLAAIIGGLPLQCQPGAEFNYSFSTDIVGRVIEVVSGQSLGMYLARNVLRPLQMKETAFFQPQQNAGRLAQAFPVDPWTGAPVPLFDMLQQAALQSGGGGLTSTAIDYARFCQMLLNGGALDGERIIGRKTLALMASDHLGAGVKIVGDVLPAGYGFGLGFAVRNAAGMAPVAGTPGQFHWSGIAGTLFWIDPVEDMFAILMTQGPGQRTYLSPMFRNMVHAAIET